MAERSNLKYPPKIIPSPSKRHYPETKQREKEVRRFPTYHEAPYLTPRTRMLCEIIEKTPVSEVENAFNSTGITPIPELVEAVLKLSYGSPDAAVSFFRWAGYFHKPSVHAWNLMVDLLGKNEMFDQMWDAIRSMRNEGFVSLATFVSVFGSYCEAGKFEDAFMTFEVMGKYGVEPDVVALNSLLSAICQEKDQTDRAYNFLEKVRAKIRPNGDTYAILLEGWEKEGNINMAWKTIGGMVTCVKWDANNMTAYTTFLSTLFRGSQVEEAIKFLNIMKKNECLVGLEFFSNALDILLKQNNSINVIPLWDFMVESGVIPNLITCNTIISLLCSNNDVNNAFRLLDEMPIYGVFPDSLTYNVIFECLVKDKKVREVASFFKEMTKNESSPIPANCAAAIETLFQNDDPETAIEIWNYMLKNEVMPIDESANVLLMGLCELRRFLELKRFAFDMLDLRIIIHESTMKKLRNAFYNEGRSIKDTYDTIERRWKAAYTS